MYWNSFSEFCAMGGYALYVWGAMLVVAVCVAGELLQLRQRQRRAEALTAAAVVVPHSSHEVQDEATA